LELPVWRLALGEVRLTGGVSRSLVELFAAVALGIGPDDALFLVVAEIGIGRLHLGDRAEHG
jgi:hypothetical protein